MNNFSGINNDDMMMQNLKKRNPWFTVCLNSIYILHNNFKCYVMMIVIC